MAHVAAVVKVERVGNGALAFHARCCGDARSERRATIYFTAAMTDAQIEEKVALHLAETQKLHAAAERVEQVLAKFPGKE